MEALIKALVLEYPQFTFVSGSHARWSPLKQEITYPLVDNEAARWSMFHELGHGLLCHASYESDLHLLQKEAAAWAKAIEVAKRFSITIDNDHVQDCLDTYRDWLHKRSTCPICGNHGLQPTQSLYRCLNCQNTWKVGSDRFCRPYRLKSRQTT